MQEDRCGNVGDEEKIGRTVIAEGLLAGIRSQFSLSVRRTADLLSTSSQIITRWEADPASSTTMRAESAVRMARFAISAWRAESQVSSDGRGNYQITDLVPITLLSSRLGLSPASVLIADKCRTGELTCFVLGRFGVYIPRAESDAVPRLNRR